MAAGRWDGLVLTAAAVVAPLAGREVANPFRPPPAPRELTAAERERQSRKGWAVLDAWMEQSFGS